MNRCENAYLVLKRKGEFMKKKVAVILGVLLLAVALLLVIKPSSFEKKADKTLQKLTSYKLEGNMEISSGEEFKNYAITSSWMKEGEDEFFKVSMVDKSLNQEQIILKNKDGVFVVTPSLNQVFKFQGEWPMNSPKPYLLQTMLEVIKGDHQMKKEKDGYLVSSDASYPSATNLIRQEIKFNKEVKPIYLMAYNQDNVAALTMEFTNVAYNEGFDAGYFETPKTSIDTPTSGYTGMFDLPLYPMSVFDSKLVSSSVANVNGQEQHILEFSGDKSFTVVQTELAPNQDLAVTEVSGELVEGLGLVGYFDGSRLTAMDSQVQYSVYSSDLTPQEMMQIIQSMQVSVMK